MRISSSLLECSKTCSMVNVIVVLFHLLKICTYSDPSYEYKFYFFSNINMYRNYYIYGDHINGYNKYAILPIVEYYGAEKLREII